MILTSVPLPHHHFLGGPGYGSQETPEEAYYISNAIGITDHSQGDGMFERWRQLIHEQLAGWVTLYAPLNVVLGPVFDNDNNGLVDALTSSGYGVLRESGSCPR